jgi:hypothetical protein
MLMPEQNSQAQVNAPLVRRWPGFIVSLDIDAFSVCDRQAPPVDKDYRMK